MVIPQFRTLLGAHPEKGTVSGSMALWKGTCGLKSWLCCSLDELPGSLRAAVGSLVQEGPPFS